MLFTFYTHNITCSLESKQQIKKNKGFFCCIRYLYICITHMLLEKMKGCSGMKTINVRKRKASVFGGFKKIMCIFIGATGFACSIALFFTIVGIPLALFIWAGSIAILAAASNKYKVKCPECKKDHIIGEDQEDFTCKRCKAVTLINWTK